MSDVFVLTCASCGGKLQITTEIDRFACAYCGTEQIVKRSGGTVSLVPVIAGIKRVQAGVDKTASELAIVRLIKEIDELTQQKANLEPFPKSAATGCTWLIFLGLAWAMSALSFGMTGFITILVAILFIFCIFLIVSILDSTKKSNDVQATYLNNEITRRKSELSRNRQVVDKN